MGEMAELAYDNMERGQSVIEHKETGKRKIEDNIVLVAMSSKSLEKYRILGDYNEEYDIYDKEYYG